MSSPFSNSLTYGRPSWQTVATVNGNFTVVNVTGTTVVEEVGFGMGGFGEGGFDTKTLVIGGAAAPNWATVAVK